MNAVKRIKRESVKFQHRNKSGVYHRLKKEFIMVNEMMKEFVRAYQKEDCCYE